jgi:hypothetical protein
LHTGAFTRGKARKRKNSQRNDTGVLEDVRHRRDIWHAMSALGHKRTCAVQKGMSALPPKADIGTRTPASSQKLTQLQTTRPR